MRALRAVALAAAIFAGVSMGVLCLTAARGIAPVLTDAAAISSNLRDTSVRVNRASAELLDCKGNPNCVQSRWSAISGAGKFVAGQAAKAAPDAAAGVASAGRELGKVRVKGSWLMRRAGIDVEEKKP